MEAIDTKEIARKRYQAALDKIERAQNILSEAAGEGSDKNLGFNRKTPSFRL